MKTDIVLKTLLFNSDGKLLLLRRSETDARRPLQWDFPGGLQDQGETLETGAIREVKEETGINVSDLDLIFTKTELGKWIDDKGSHERNVIRIYFLAKTIDENVILSFEHDKFCWVSVDEAQELIIYPRHLEVLEYVKTNKLVL